MCSNGLSIKFTHKIQLFAFLRSTRIAYKTGGIEYEQCSSSVRSDNRKNIIGIEWVHDTEKN